MTRSLTIYDKYGNRTEETRYDSSGSVTNRVVITTDKKLHKPAEERFYDRGVTLEASTSHKYNEKGQLTETLWYDQNGEVMRKTKKTYSLTE